MFIRRDCLSALPAVLLVVAALAVAVDTCRPIVLTRDVRRARVVVQSGEHEVSVAHHDSDGRVYWSERVVCDVRVEGLDLPIRCGRGEACCTLVAGLTYHLRLGQSLLAWSGCGWLPNGHCSYEVLDAPEAIR